MPSKKTEFSIDSVLFSSPRIREPIELRLNVTDIDVYEDLDKPYLTANIVFVDSNNFIENADILGGENITIAISSMRSQSARIVKNFYINKITHQERVNDNTQVVVLHLIEDCAYISNLINVNRYYEGTGSQIIEKICGEFLGRQFTSSNSDLQLYKLIVPNLDPLQTCKWIANNLTTVEGFPYYLYSTFVGNKIVLRDLIHLITSAPLNTSSMYQWSQSAVQSREEDVQRRTIHSFKIGKNSEDLFSIIRKGLIGGKYSYLNIAADNEETEVEFPFDVVEDVLRPAIGTGVIPGNQNNVGYSPRFQLGSSSFNQIPSRHITHLGGTNPYRITKLPDDPEELPQFPLALGEAYDEAFYKLFVIRRAMDNLLKKSAITINVNGIDFIDGDKHSTIGNQLRCRFQHSNPEIPFSSRNEWDTKLSGDYLIYRTRHVIKRERYDMAHTMVKIGSYPK